MIGNDDVEEAYRLYYRLGVLVIISMIIQLSVIAYVFYSNYQGRQDQIKNSRTACERNKLDRRDNARMASANANNWNQASSVRRKDGDTMVADEYEMNAQIQKQAAASLQNRAKLDCTIAFPNASLMR